MSFWRLIVRWQIPLFWPCRSCKSDWKLAILSHSEPLSWEKIGKVVNRVQNWPFLVILSHFSGERLEKLQIGQNWSFWVIPRHFSGKSLEKLPTRTKLPNFSRGILSYISQKHNGNVVTQVKLAAEFWATLVGNRLFSFQCIPQTMKPFQGIMSTAVHSRKIGKVANFTEIGHSESFWATSVLENCQKLWIGPDWSFWWSFWASLGGKGLLNSCFSVQNLLLVFQG